MSEAALAKMIEIIEKTTETSIQSEDMRTVINFFHANRQYIDAETENQDLAELALEYIEKMGISTETKELNLKESEPKKIAIENFLGLSIPKKEKIMHISLDSRYAEFLDTRHEMRWNIENALITINETKNRDLNNAFVTSTPKDITYIRMYSFVVRQFTQVMDRVSVLIHEFDSQCMTMNERKFHFIALPNDLKYPLNIFNRNSATSGLALVDHTLHKRYELLSGYRFNEGFYRFDKSFSVLPSTLTVSVGDPINKIKFQRHYFKNCTATFSVFPSGWLVMAIILPENHDMWTNYFNPQWNAIRSIFIDNFTTSNPVTDATLISWINSREHTLIHTDTVTPNNQMEVMLEIPAPPGDYSSVVGIPYTYPNIPQATVLSAPVGVPSTFDVRINGERIIITLEMGFMDYA